MSSAANVAGLIARPECIGSQERDGLPFPDRIVSRPGARPPSRRAFCAADHRVEERLTGREHEILVMIGQGFCSKRVARTLQISPETVKTHLKRTFLKLEVSSRAEAVFRAGAMGLF